MTVIKDYREYQYFSLSLICVSRFLAYCPKCLNMLVETDVNTTWKKDSVWSLLEAECHFCLLNSKAILFWYPKPCYKAGRDWCDNPIQPPVHYLVQDSGLYPHFLNLFVQWTFQHTKKIFYILWCQIAMWNEAWVSTAALLHSESSTQELPPCPQDCAILSFLAASITNMNQQQYYSCPKGKVIFLMSS